VARFPVSLLLAGTLALAGCASRADLIAQERRIAQQMGEQRKQIQAIQRELERMRGDVEGGSRGGAAAGSSAQRLQDMENRLAQLEGRAPADTAAPVGEPPAGRDVAPPPSGVAPAPREPSPPPPAPVAPTEDAWGRDVAREQQTVAAGNAPERAEFSGILDSLAKKDCGRAVGQLNTFAAQKKESPLAADALYWAARCHALRGDRNQAITKFYDVVTKYPRGSKAPAALWEQGNLFIEMGDNPDARVALGKLIKDYPNSEEAGRARKRLTDLDR